MIVETVGSVLFIEANQNTVVIFHSIHSYNAHLQDMLNKGTAELAEIRICHVIWYPNNTRQWLPSNLTQRNKLELLEREIPLKNENQKQEEDGYTGREEGVSSGKTCMRPRVSSILGFPEEKLNIEVENEDDSLCSSSESLLEPHIASLLKYS